MAFTPIAKVVAAATAATTIINVARYVLEMGRDVNDSVSNLSVNSLPAFNRQTTIVSRAYIDGNIADDAIIPDVLRACQTLYVAWIINALQLNRLVTADRTVREMLHVVATEGLLDDCDDIGSEFETEAGVEPDEAISQEAFYGSIGPNGGRGGYANDKGWVEGEYDKDGVRIEVGDQSGKYSRTIGDRESNNYQNARTNITDITPSGADGLPTGRMIEVTLTNPENKDANVTMTLTVQILPYIVPAQAATQFVLFNTKPSSEQRWAQFKAGEITLIRDLFLQMDLNEKRRAAIKADRDDVLGDFLRTQVRKDQKTLLGLLSRNQSAPRNTANTILILDMETVRRAQDEAGFNLMNKSDRDRYFRETYAMIIVIVDTMHNEVHMAYNGIDAVGTFNFSQFKAKSKQGDVVDMLQAMAMFNQGRAPKI